MIFKPAPFPIKLDKRCPVCYTDEAMKYTILVCILSDLLEKRRLTAAYFAEKYDISPRTVYRYVEILSSALPVQIKRGRSGGICLSDTYTLPVNFMTAEEYETTIEALSIAYSEGLDERFLAAKRKLSAQVKAESRTPAVSGSAPNVFVWNEFSKRRQEKAQRLEECIRDRLVTEVEYVGETGEKIKDKIEPHALVFRENAGYVYAFSYKERDFTFLPLGSIVFLLRLNERFRKRPFSPSELLPKTPLEEVQVRLEISENALVKARERLGAETLYQKDGKWQADISVTDENAAVQLLLSLGAGVKVLSPLSLREKVRAAAQDVVNAYS